MSDALERIGEQVTIAAHRHFAVRRRRRKGAIGVLTTVFAVGAVSAASAIAGVGPMQDLLGAGAKVAPTANEPRVSVSASDAQGTAWTVRAYRAGGATYCIQAPAQASSQVAEGVCAPYDRIAADLAETGIFATVSSPASSNEVNLFFGIARGDVEAITITDAQGHAARATVSSVWTHEPAGGQNTDALRAFLAISEGPRPYIERPAQVEVLLANGTHAETTWPAP